MVRSGNLTTFFNDSTYVIFLAISYNILIQQLIKLHTALINDTILLLFINASIQPFSCMFNFTDQFFSRVCHILLSFCCCCLQLWRCQRIYCIVKRLHKPVFQTLNQHLQTIMFVNASPVYLHFKSLFPKNQTNSADNIRQKVTHLPYLLSDPLINNTQNKHDNCKRYVDSAGNFPKQGRH